MECVGVLIEESQNEGYCELGEDCTALPLLEESYAAYREAHHNRSGRKAASGGG